MSRVCPGVLYSKGKFRDKQSGTFPTKEIVTHWKRHLRPTNDQNQINTQSLIENGSPSVIERWFGHRGAMVSRWEASVPVAHSKMASKNCYLLSILTYTHSSEILTSDNSANNIERTNKHPSTDLINENICNKSNK
jgi:hypothetical protein